MFTEIQHRFGALKFRTVVFCKEQPNKTARKINRTVFIKFLFEKTTVNLLQEDKCYGSAKSMDVVYDCPKNTKALQERAARKNCQIYPSCQNEPLVYHCVRYTDSLVEVCAPRGLITGRDSKLYKFERKYARTCT